MCLKSCDMPFWWPLAAPIEKHGNSWACNGCFGTSGVSAVAEACAVDPAGACCFSTRDKEHVCSLTYKLGALHMFILFGYKTDGRPALPCVILNNLLFSSTDRTSLNLSVCSELLNLCIKQYLIYFKQTIYMHFKLFPVKLKWIMILVCKNI